MLKEIQADGQKHLNALVCDCTKNTPGLKQRTIVYCNSESSEVYVKCGHCGDRFVICKIKDFNPL